MQKINLRELYPDIYKTDTFLEVTDEVQAVFLADKRAEARYLRQMYNYKAHYSLDCDNGIEKAVVQHAPTPEEILEDKQLRDQLYAAVMGCRTNRPSGSMPGFTWHDSQGNCPG